MQAPSTDVSMAMVAAGQIWTAAAGFQARGEVAGKGVLHVYVQGPSLQATELDAFQRGLAGLRLADARVREVPGADRVEATLLLLHPGCRAPPLHRSKELVCCEAMDGDDLDDLLRRLGGSTVRYDGGAMHLLRTAYHATRLRGFEAPSALRYEDGYELDVPLREPVSLRDLREVAKRLTGSVCDLLVEPGRVTLCLDFGVEFNEWLWLGEARVP